MTDTLKFLRRNWIAILFILAVSLVANTAQPMRMDDATFLNTYTSHGNDLWSWAQEYWVTWSGRIVPHGVFMILLAFSPELVNILNAVMITVSLILTAQWAIRNQTTDRVAENILLLLMGISMYALTPTSILDVTVFWKTASVLYIWGFAAMLFILTPFLRPPGYYTSGHKAGKLRSLVLLPPALYCAGFEPSGVFYFVFGGIILLTDYLKQQLFAGNRLLLKAYRSLFGEEIHIINKTAHYPKHVLICWSITTAAFFLFLSAPGNVVRFQEEALFWFPNYGLFGIKDKMFLGVSYMLGAALGEIYLPLFFLSLAIVLLIIIRKRGIVLILTALIPFLYYGLYPFAKESPAYAFIYNDVYGIYTGANWFATFLGIFAMVSTALLILFGISETLEFVNALFYMGAVLEQIVLGFTPTVAISISRSTFFSRELLMIPLFSLLLMLYTELKSFISGLCLFH